MSSLTQWVTPVLLLSALPSLCLAQSVESAARVVELSGQVSVLRDSTPWALNVDSLVQVRQVILTGPDGHAILKVTDGSTFEVFPNSRVVFRANPANWKDLLDLYLGRVKVHIQKYGAEPNNNRIKTPTAVISVRGTVFDVHVEDENATLVSVEEGQVEVADLIFGTRKLLNQGESQWIYKDQPLARRASPIKGAVAKKVGDAAVEAVIRILRNPGGAPRGGGGVPTPGGGGTPLPGDTETNPPPPPPPPPPPAN